MKRPDDVAEVLRLKACGWGLKRIARQLGCSHQTVKAYVGPGGVKPFKSPERPKLLNGIEGLAARAVPSASRGHGFARLPTVDETRCRVVPRRSGRTDAHS